MNEGLPSRTETHSESEDARIERLKGEILTSEQYRDHAFAANAEGKRIYSYELTDGEHTLTYIGAPHTKQVDDPAFEEIRQAFEKANPDIVYVEGQAQINSQKDKIREHAKEVSIEEAKARGENFYTLKLAIDSGADFESPEYMRVEEIRLLEESGYTHEEIFNFYFARSVYGYQHSAAQRGEVLSKEDCLTYIASNLKPLREAEGWSEEEVGALQEKAVAELDVEHKDYGSLVDPIPWKDTEYGMTNKIASRLSMLRDQYGLERIAEGLKGNKRIFVVYGSAHAVRLEPALRMLMKKNLL